MKCRSGIFMPSAVSAAPEPAPTILCSVASAAPQSCREIMTSNVPLARHLVVGNDDVVPIEIASK